MQTPHWRYFQLLEDDLSECYRYVHPCREHFDVHSEHFARIILMASTEIENCIRGYAHSANYAPVPGSIGQYFTFINSRHPSFTASKIHLPEYSLDFEPWNAWSSANAPDWWTYGYNKVKHDRLQYPNAPTMRRATESVGALFVLLLHYYSYLDPQCCLPMNTAPTLFVLHEEPTDFESGGVYWSWTLP